MTLVKLMYNMSQVAKLLLFVPCPFHNIPPKSNFQLWY